MYVKPDISKKLNSPKTIDKIIKNALRNEYISVENACCILAVWDIFINHLERVYVGYDFERAKAFDEDGMAFKSDLSSKEGRYLLLNDLFGMWTRNNYWGGIRQSDDDILKTYVLNNKTYALEPDGGNGTLIKLVELKEFFDIHQLPLDIFSDASERSLVEKEAQTDRTNQSTIPYNGLGVERTKHCLKEWKASDGFIGLDQFQRQILGLYRLCKTKFKDVGFPKPLIRIPDQENISALATEQATGPEPENLHIELPSTNVNNTDTLFGKKERKKTPDQLAKIKCREIAREAWESDPLMTIADFAVSDDVSRACIAIAGKDYIEDTIRDWVKDLCPNRKGGRRPKK